MKMMLNYVKDGLQVNIFV
ncbi:hypothetical protein BLA29_011260 [Euroglyphus maynei]|uniref:Uncharacterized protein n=1 Tax=Euroglyphus maynei TaxID=6958 RepID=A0A1Y3ALY6_EURMA|nr:hypothetical protein BLA29_011260 [Euroglyphus maynei]